MVQYKMSNSQLNKLKSAIKNETEVTLNLSSNLIGSFNDETSFPHKLLLTDKQASKNRKAFANGSSANVIFSKTQLSQILEFGGVPLTYLFLEIFYRVQLKKEHIQQEIQEKTFSR